MRLSWTWPSRAEDRFESWLAQSHEERVLAGETTPSAVLLECKLSVTLAAGWTASTTVKLAASPALLVSSPVVGKTRTSATAPTSDKLLALYSV